MAWLRKNLFQVEKVEINLVKRILKPGASEETVRKGHHHFNKIIAMPCPAGGVNAVTTFLWGLEM